MEDSIDDTMMKEETTIKNHFPWRAYCGGDVLKCTCVEEWDLTIASRMIDAVLRSFPMS